MRPPLLIYTLSGQITELFGCAKDVFVLAMNYVDRYLCKVKVSLRRLQLLGACAMLVASKYSGPSQMHVPSLCDCMDSVFSIQDIKVSSH